MSVYFVHCVVWLVLLTPALSTRPALRTGIQFGQDDDSLDRDDCPVNVTVTDISYKTLIVSWSPPTNATYQNYTNYMVYYGSDVIPLRPPSVGLQSRVVDINVTDFLLKGLDPGTRYNIYVLTNSSEGALARCAPLTVQTLGYGPDKLCDCELLGINRSLPASHHCHFMTGRCLCRNKFTTGPRCDQCHVGYYWHIKLGCDRCHCPSDGLHGDGNCYPDEHSLIRCRCLNNFSGLRCDMCDTTSYRDAKGYCVPCECHGNSRAGPGQPHCDDQGVCLACGDNTTGDWCERCVDGYHGDALYHNCTLPVTVAPPHHDLGIQRTEVITGLLALFAVAVVVTTTMLLYKRCRRQHKHLPVWTVALQDNQEKVEFSADGVTEYNSLEQHLLTNTDTKTPA